MSRELPVTSCQLTAGRPRAESGHWQLTTGNCRRGFSFTEIMFAVMILGIGFIMVAGIFPVALQQSKSTTEEITAAPNARGAVNYLTQLVADGPQPFIKPDGTIDATITTNNTSNCPPVLGNQKYSGAYVIGVVAQPYIWPINATNVLSPTIRSTFTPPYAAASLWDQMRGNMILPEDQRYGFIALYLRRLQDPTRLDATGNLDTSWHNWNPYVQVYVFPVQARATPTFTAADLTTSALTSNPNTFDETTMPVPNLMARPVQVVVLDSDSLSSTIPQLTGQPDLLAFDVTSNPGVQKVQNVQAAIEGAYVVIADDKIKSPAGPHTTTPPTPDDRGRMNGRLFRLGARRADLDNNNILFPTLTQSVVYELQPGSDFTADPGDDGIKGTSESPNWAGNDDITAIGMSCPSPSQVTVVTGTTSANAYLIGKGYSDPNNPAAGYEGAAMPIGAYVTYMKVQ